MPRPESIYAVMLKLYPRQFRREYGDEMIRTFRDQHCHSVRVGQARQFCVCILADLLRTVPVQHIEAVKAFGRMPDMLNKLLAIAAAMVIAFAGAIAGKSSVVDLSIDIDLLWPASLVMEIVLHAVRDTTIAALAVLAFSSMTRTVHRGNILGAIALAAALIAAGRFAYILTIALAPVPAYEASSLHVFRYCLQFVPLFAGVAASLLRVCFQPVHRSA